MATVLQCLLWALWGPVPIIGNILGRRVPRVQKSIANHCLHSASISSSRSGLTCSLSRTHTLSLSLYVYTHIPTYTRVLYGAESLGDLET